MSVRALIVEDEPLAIDRLRACLSYIDNLDLIGEARDGKVAVTQIDRLQPDLVFLDIQLPVFSGFEVLRATQHRPGVIFTTAHNEYAVSAFEWGAFDYLLKPFDRDRVAVAMSRFRHRSGFNGDGHVLADQLDTAESKGLLKRFFVKQRGVAIPVDCDRVVAVVAEGDYCRVHLAQESHLVHLPLREFEKRLGPDLFVRIHRSALIGLNHMLKVEDAGRGARVCMSNGLRVTASRTGATQLRRLHL